MLQKDDLRLQPDSGLGATALGGGRHFPAQPPAFAICERAGRRGRRVVSAFVATAFAQDDAAAARDQWRRVADQLQPKLPKLAGFLAAAEEDVLAYMTFPAAHRAKLYSTNPLGRLNGEIKRRTEVVGIFPYEAAIVRLVGAILLEQNDEWAVQRCR